MKKILFSAFLGLVMAITILLQSAVAVELSGKVFSEGSPLGNVIVAVKGTETKVRTAPNGAYQVDLPPGEHTLVVLGQEFLVNVTSPKTTHDIQF